MRRIVAFCVSTWLAAAILLIGRHSVPLMALSGVIVFAGLDLFRPEPQSQSQSRPQDR
ncbi:hypothetical protein [Paraburkholderia acidisoli]|uniref:hypothetical protein n=1 Tax=Paraburkholderia acidisoli TaxID=2571748 RepID=UPI0018EF0A4D|nr:hypothetical protein [Paraburkholderia acidisoli]